MDTSPAKVDTFGRKVDTLPPKLTHQAEKVTHRAKNWTHCPTRWTHPPHPRVPFVIPASAAVFCRGRVSDRPLPRTQQSRRNLPPRPNPHPERTSPSSPVSLLYPLPSPLLQLNTSGRKLNTLAQPSEHIPSWALTLRLPSPVIPASPRACPEPVEWGDPAPRSIPARLHSW